MGVLLLPLRHVKSNLKRAESVFWCDLRERQGKGRRKCGGQTLCREGFLGKGCTMLLLLS